MCPLPARVANRTGPSLPEISRTPGRPGRCFAATLTELGYEMAAGAPAPGSIIGFDADARAHVIATGVDLPDEFVEPIAVWLAQHGSFGSANAM